MKTISKVQHVIIAAILLIGYQLNGQSLLLNDSIVVKVNCEDPNTIINDITLTLQPDDSINTNYNILRYNWQGPLPSQTGTSETFSANRSGTYRLTVDALRLSDSVTVSFTDALEVTFDAVCCEIQLPNAFTPNDDNRNDVFAPVLPQHCVFQEYQLQVYNRWGQKIFDTQLMNTPVSNNIVLGWDGKIDGKEAPSDVYVYWLRYTAVGNDNTYMPATHKGNVTLIR